MARGPRYKVPKKRRREGKTNYYKRYTMLKSGKDVRLVVRISNKHVVVQFIRFSARGDETLVGVSSKTLFRYGWKGYPNNTPATYLVGLIAGLKARKLGISYAVPDIGLHKPVRGSRVFAAIKGCIDAGIEVPVSKEVLPTDDRIRGEHIANYARELLSIDEGALRKRFSKVLSSGLNLLELPKHFAEVKENILRAFS
ncbi:MAG: 50S ribosomal protein L18 [Sulfolobales archaeon]